MNLIQKIEQEEIARLGKTVPAFARRYCSSTSHCARSGSASADRYRQYDPALADSQAAPATADSVIPPAPRTSRRIRGRATCGVPPP